MSKAKKQNEINREQAEQLQESGPRIPGNLPVMPLQDAIVFPMMALPLTLTNKRAIQIVDDAMEADDLFVTVMVRDRSKNEVGVEDLEKVGAVVTIAKMLRLPDGNVQILVNGVKRARLDNYTQIEPYPRADITVLEEQAGAENDETVAALMHSLRDTFQKLTKLNRNVPQEFAVMVLNLSDPNRLADVLSTVGEITPLDRQRVLETVDVKERLELVNQLLIKTVTVLEIGTAIQSKVRDQMDKTQRDYILREQMKTIQSELGEKDEKTIEIEEFKDKIAKAKMPEEALKAAGRELDRLAKMPPSAAEYTVSRTYLEWLTELPWSVESKDNLNLARVQKTLDADHYGLDKVKERITEFLAVRKLKKDMKSPILCFVGPPGVGKTSLGKSIANAMNRKFFRFSLGGVHDEAEIRGHRRTYVGALPGRILQAVRRSGTRNPVIMMDEVDKIGMDFRGDPSSALLEVLDPEQNFSFHDHYIDVGFDLSKVLFIVTANVLHTIPEPLRDRMEVLELPGYTETEKVEIAKRYLIPRQCEEHGLPKGHVKFQDDVLKKIILDYTKEAGVRNIDREVARIHRKTAKNYSLGKKTRVTVTADKLEELLGKPRRQLDRAERVAIPGVAIGMAWTGYGGDILFIEASTMRGNGRLILTGKLGDVMKESAQAALSYLRANAKKLGIPETFFEKKDIHIHVPAGAIPKDGPSAGVTMFTALYSLITGKLVQADLSMTGEISLRGQVLPVGGIKEKVMAAHRAGIKTILMPDRNSNDLDEVPDEIKNDLTVHFLKTLDDVVRHAFGRPARKKPAPAAKKPALKRTPAKIAATKNPAGKPAAKGK
jgi:ATP-dependent Lon protease